MKQIVWITEQTLCLNNLRYVFNGSFKRFNSLSVSFTKRNKNKR